MMKPADFVDTLSGLVFQDTFNPYLHRCPVHDRDDAPSLRRGALLEMLQEAAPSDVEAIWVGRDLGYRGGRRTGLALTDDRHIKAHATRWSIDITRPTEGEMVSEKTAAVVWDVLAHVTSQVFLWNVFPFHPHEPSEPFSNRAHNASERAAGEDVLVALIELLRPRRLVAIGNIAADSARRVCGTVEVVHVRHPSYGGRKEFLKNMRALYGVDRRPPLHCPTFHRDKDVD